MKYNHHAGRNISQFFDTFEKCVLNRMWIVFVSVFKCKNCGGAGIFVCNIVWICVSSLFERFCVFVWALPAFVWALPASVWALPAFVWALPAFVWALPAFAWALPAFAWALPASVWALPAFAWALPAFAWALPAFAWALPAFAWALPAFVWAPLLWLRMWCMLLFSAKVFWFCALAVGCWKVWQNISSKAVSREGRAPEVDAGLGFWWFQTYWTRGIQTCIWDWCW